jgi:phage tail-like protein
MATIINNRSTLETDPIRNFRFLVTFKPHVTADADWLNNAPKKVTVGFTSVSGLSVQTDSIPYREGGYNTTVHQIPGQTTFAPITLQRGVVLGTKQHWDWMRHLFATVQGNSTTALAQNFRCDIEIAVLSHPVPSKTGQESVMGNPGVANDHVAMRFHVYNTWPTAVAYSDLNAGDNAIFVEQMTLVHEGFDVTWATSLTAGGTAAKKPSSKKPTTGGGGGSKSLMNLP